MSEAPEAPIHYNNPESYAWQSGWSTGWDAAKAEEKRRAFERLREFDEQVEHLPDRDELIELFEDQGRWATSDDLARAVLALLRGEGEGDE